MFSSAALSLLVVLYQSKLEMIVGFYEVSYTVGELSGSIIGGYLEDTFGFASPFIMSGILCILMIILVVINIPSKVSQGKALLDDEEFEKEQN